MLHHVKERAAFGVRFLQSARGMGQPPAPRGHHPHCDIAISPLECLQRLAAPVSRPRLHLIGFHDVWRPTPSGAAIFPARSENKSEYPCRINDAAGIVKAPASGW